MFENLLVEKYRPTSLDTLILSSKNKRIFNNIKDDISHLLFVGPPGIGKTSTARIIVCDILKCQYLYINASDESGIDTIRTKVVNFSRTKSIDGKIKVVVLDEADGISPEGMRALRNTMEEYASNTRFILTANYAHKIIPAIRSRTQYIDLTPPLEQVKERVYKILEDEGITYNKNDRDSIDSIVSSNYPDIRKTINTIQLLSTGGEFRYVETNSHDKLVEVIHKCVKKKDIIKLREFLIKNESSFQGDYHSLMKSYLNYIISTDMEYVSKCLILSNIADFMYKDAIVLDKEINAFNCWIKIQGCF